MVMSQSAIDALMAANNAANGEDPQDEGALEALSEDTEAGTSEDGPSALSADELAVVQAAAEEDGGAAPTAEDTVAAPETPEEPTPKLRTWSASATSQTDQLRDRVQDIEDKLSIIEASTLNAEPTPDPVAMNEVKQIVDSLSTTVKSLWAAVQNLTEQSQASLGFAAKQTFDCPECGSHGTIAVPINCTACGFESEWGFFPEQ
jgi:hypothetical protein